MRAYSSSQSFVGPRIYVVYPQDALNETGPNKILVEALDDALHHKFRSNYGGRIPSTSTSQQQLAYDDGFFIPIIDHHFIRNIDCCMIIHHHNDSRLKKPKDKVRLTKNVYALVGKPFKHHSHYHKEHVAAEIHIGRCCHEVGQWLSQIRASDPQKKIARIDLPATERPSSTNSGIRLLVDLIDDLSKAYKKLGMVSRVASVAIPDMDFKRAGSNELQPKFVIFEMTDEKRIAIAEDAVKFDLYEDLSSGSSVAWHGIASGPPEDSYCVNLGAAFASQMAERARFDIQGRTLAARLPYHDELLALAAWKKQQGLDPRPGDGSDDAPDGEIVILHTSAIGASPPVYLRARYDSALARHVDDDLPDPHIETGRNTGFRLCIDLPDDFKFDD